MVPFFVLRGYTSPVVCQTINFGLLLYSTNFNFCNRSQVSKKSVNQLLYPRMRYMTRRDVLTIWQGINMIALRNRRNSIFTNSIPRHMMLPGLLAWRLGPTSGPAQSVEGCHSISCRKGQTTTSMCMVLPHVHPKAKAGRTHLHQVHMTGHQPHLLSSMVIERDGRRTANDLARPGELRLVFQKTHTCPVDIS